MRGSAPRRVALVSAPALCVALLLGGSPIDVVRAGQPGGGDCDAAGSIDAALAARPCTGDCDGDNTVSIDETIRAVNIGVGTLPLASCPAADGDGDGLVHVDEVIGTVAAGLSGCAAADPTTTRTPSLGDCVQIAGDWIFEELGSTECQVIGKDRPQFIEFEGSEEIEITQDGCAVRYEIPRSDLVREGVVAEDRVFFFGPMFEPERGVTYRLNATIIEGIATSERIDLTASGRAEGSVSNSGDFLCVASSVVTFTRTN